jgi:hypothetical protein
MIRTRHRLLAFVAAAVALTVAAEASAQSTLLQLAYSNAKTYGNVHIAGGAIDLTNGAMIVTTSSFGFVPSGGQANERGTPGTAEYGDNAIHDAIIEGANLAGGFWNGSNGITSSYAANWGNGDIGVYYLDNNFVGLPTFRGIPISASQSVIATTWFGDGDLNGVVNSDDYGLWLGYLATHTTLYGGPPESVDGDFDYSGVVNSDDYGAWLGTQALGDGTAPITGGGLWYGPIVPSSSGPVSVPEPASVVLLGFAAVAGLAYRYTRKARV